jgi:hypothetical protein
MVARKDVSKKMTMPGMVVGSIARGYLPAVFGLDEIIVSRVSAFHGGIIGIWPG